MRKQILFSIIFLAISFSSMAQCGLQSFNLLIPGPEAISATSVFLTWTDAGTNNVVLKYAPVGGAFQFYPQDAKILAPGTMYQFQATSQATCFDDQGTFVSESVNTPIILVTTEPPAPGNLVLTSITSSSFSASWDVASGASGYELEISTDVNFSTISSYPTSLSNYSVNGLNGGTTYYARVRAVNFAGASGYTSTNATTVPSAPGANSATSVTTDGFIANWDGVTGAASYKLDVATANDFSAGSLLANYNNFNVVGTSKAVTGLTPGTPYYYRVRASNATGTSANSNTISTKTICETPTAQNASSIQASSFTANWTAVTGADSYRLDVATDNGFIFMVTGYNNLTVNATSKNITTLTGGTTYYYRVRAINTTGASANSITTGVLTKPDAPNALTSTGVNTDAFTANWDATAGTASYRLDVATNNTFTNILAGYNNITVNANSKIITTLTAGTTYYFRVRAVNNSGTSVNSNVISTQTIPLAPVALNATNVLATSFTAKWQGSTGAANYRLDVALDNAFNTLVPGYNNLQVNATSQVVNNLTAGTTYYYRVRASITGGTSVYSNVISTLTLPDAPANFRVVNFQPTSLTAEWVNATSATEYELEVATDEAFTNLIAGYNPKVIPVGTTSHVVQNLTPVTTYYFRIRSKNPSGVSATYSNSQGLTSSVDGGQPIQLSSLTLPDYYETGQSTQQKISAIVTGGTGALTVDFYHRKNRETAFLKETITSTTETYFVTLLDNWFDVFGMEFYFEVQDQGGQVKREPVGNGVHTVSSGVSSFNIPVNTFGKEIKNYQIISFPYTLSRKKIEDVFVPKLGEYNKSSWRFVKYEDGKNKDYQSDGIRIRDIEQGEGYWFISKNEVDLTFNSGIGYGNSAALPFTLPLKKGWNQIGNPFPYNINWQDVLAFNANDQVGNLLVFDQQNVSFAESDLLKVFGGGFVHADNDTELIFPVTLPEIANGRLDKSMVANDFGNDETVNSLNWALPITLAQGEVSTRMSGVGMHTQASEEKDSFDRITPPRFFHYVELNSKKEVGEYALSFDVVPYQDRYTWNFAVESNSNEPVVLKWNRLAIASRNAQLILYDQSKQVLIDMAKLDTHSTAPDAKISIHYARAGQMEVDYIKLGTPYPNPFNSEIKIPFDFSVGESSQAELSIFSFNGSLMVNKKIEYEGNHLGVQTVQWNGVTEQGNEAPSGIYLYQVRVISNGTVRNFNGRIIKQ